MSQVEMLEESKSTHYYLKSEVIVRMPHEHDLLPFLRNNQETMILMKHTKFQ